MKHLEICEADSSIALERCLEIRNRVFCIEKGVPKSIETDKYDCMNEICNHFLIIYDKKDIGTIRCLHTSKNTVRIQRFCLLKDYRGLGLGKAIVENIENHYKNQGVTKIEMDAKYEVSKFYEKCGYSQISDIFMEANVKRVKMLKEI